MKLALTSAGAPRHGKNLCAQVQRLSDKAGYGWETTFWEWLKDGYDSYDLASIDWLWNVGNFGAFFQWLGQANPRPRAIAEWIGTDITQHQEIVQRGIPDPFNAATIHVADAPNLVDEARELTGLDVGYVRSIPPETYSPSPIERWDRILCYIPQGREDFFRWDIIREVAADYPGIRFMVLGRTEDLAGASENVHIVPEIAGEHKNALLRDCFAYLRPCQHDGIGLTLIEMAQLGRYVFHSDTRIPHVLPIRSAGEAEFHLDRILGAKIRTGPNPAAGEYYAREYSESALADDLDRLRKRMEGIL